MIEFDIVLILLIFIFVATSIAGCLCLIYHQFFGNDYIRTREGYSLISDREAADYVAKACVNSSLVDQNV